MPRKFYGSSNIPPDWRDEELLSTLNYHCQRLGCLVSLYYWALEWSVHAESKWQLGEDAQPFVLIEKDLWVLGLRTIDKLWRLERRDAIRSVSAQASEPPCRKHSFGWAEVKEDADEMLTVELPFEGNSEQDRPKLTGSALVKRVQFHDGIDAIPWTEICGALCQAHTNADRHLDDAGVQWNGPPLFRGCTHGRRLLEKAALREMKPALVLDELGERYGELIDGIETVFRRDVQNEQFREETGVETIPHALAAAHRELMSELEKGIQQWRQSGRFSNPLDIHRRIERFVDALDRGGQDELRKRATLIDARCGPGTDYDSTRKQALASYKDKPRVISGSKIEIDQLRTSTGATFLDEVATDRRYVERVLNDATLNLSAPSRQAYENWRSDCREVQREAEQLEVDGCWFLFNVHEAGESSPSERAKVAKAILQPGLGGGSLETIKAAVASIMDRVPSVEVTHQEQAAVVRRPSDSGSGAAGVPAEPLPGESSQVVSALAGVRTAIDAYLDDAEQSGRGDYDLDALAPIPKEPPEDCDSDDPVWLAWLVKAAMVKLQNEYSSGDNATLPEEGLFLWKVLLGCSREHKSGAAINEAACRFRLWVKQQETWLNPDFATRQGLIDFIEQLRLAWTEPESKDVYDPADKVHELWGAMYRLGLSPPPAPHIAATSGKTLRLWLDDEEFLAQEWRKYHDALKVAETTIRDKSTVPVPVGVTKSNDKSGGKRSTVPGEAREKIIAALTKHHKLEDGGCLNLNPIKVNKFAEANGVSPSRVSDFLREKFGGFPRYRTHFCRDSAALATALKMIRGELPPTMLFNRIDDEAALVDEDAIIDPEE